MDQRLYSVADWYDAEALLTTGGERQALGRLRNFLDTQAKPLLAEYWERGEFPEQLAQPLVGLDLMEPADLTVEAPARGGFTTASGSSNSPVRTRRWPRGTQRRQGCSGPRSGWGLPRSSKRSGCPRSSISRSRASSH